jgi:hypothetical protein
MPRYKITLPNGQTHEISASRELTQQELAQVVDMLSKQSTQAPAFDLGSVSLWSQSQPTPQPTLAQLLAPPRPQPKPTQQPKPTIWSQPPVTPIRDEPPQPLPGAEDYSAFNQPFVSWKPLSPEQLAENARLVAEARKQAEQSTGGLLSQFLEALNIPLAALAAAVGATATRGGEWFGREAGQPKQVARGDWAQRFWSIYSPDLEWGAIMEAAAPGLPRLARQLLAIPADIILDPLNVATPARAAEVGGNLARRLPKLAELLEAANDLSRRGQYALLKQLHPTAAAALEGVLQRYALEGESLWDVARRRPWAMLDLYRVGGQVEPTDLLGLLQRGLRNARSDIDMRFNWANALALPEAAKNRLPAHVLEQARREAIQAAMDYAPLLSGHVWYLDSNDIRDILRTAENFIQMIAEQAGTNPQQAASAAESLRRYALANADPSLWERLMGHWKRVRTVTNFPAGAIRNFLGNFLANYLAGEPLKLSDRPLKDLIDEAFQQGATRAADIGVNVNPREGWFTRFYTGADKLAAAILSKLTGKPPEYFLIGDDFRLPETIDKLSRWGIIPFASWPMWIAPRLARGLWEKPARYAQLGRLLRAIGAREQDTNVYLPVGQVDEFGQQHKAINLEPLLPVSVYQFVPVRVSNEPPEWYSNWALPALYRQVYEAWSGGSASPAGLTTPSPELNALITFGSGVAPPALLTLLRVAAPQLFADRQELGRSDYLLRLLGVPVVANPELWQPAKQRSERREERKRMRRQQQRERQLAGEE